MSNDGDLSAEVVAGQAMYNRWTLAVYDVFVLAFSCSLIWRCPSRYMLGMYSRWVGPKHVELGAGTGYYLDRATFVQRPDVTLVDLNPVVLQTASSRIAGLHPRTVRANVLEPLPLPKVAYDSVAINFVFHCLPGDWSAKGEALAAAAAVLRPGGRLFGSTILSSGVPVTRPARALMNFYNSRGIFSNSLDDLEGLDRELGRHFSRHEIRVRGCVALFEATTPAE